jgi:hypothetical protein
MDVSAIVSAHENEETDKGRGQLQLEDSGKSRRWLT